jgi:hypothetical protein
MYYVVSAASLYPRDPTGPPGVGVDRWKGHRSTLAEEAVILVYSQGSFQT